MKSNVTLTSSQQVGGNGFGIAARRLWPFGFILAIILGVGCAFAYVFGQ